MNCDKCGTDLTEEWFTFDEEFLFCEDCYQKEKGKDQCESCGQYFKNNEQINKKCRECWNWEDKVYWELISNGYIYRYHFGQENERQVREALSNLCKEGHITYPKEPNVYYLVQNADIDDLERYLAKITQTVATTYFNRILPYKHLIHDEKLKKLMGGLEDVFNRSV